MNHPKNNQQSTATTKQGTVKMLDHDIIKNIDGSNIMTAYLYVMLFLLGTCMGSFLTCLADRHAEKESIVHGRSRCDACRHVLGPGDLVPVFSFAFHGGRCKYCGAKLAIKYLITELLMGLAFVLSVWKHGLSLNALGMLIIFCLLLPAAVEDIQTMEIPDRYFIGIIIVWALMLACDFSWDKFFESVYGGICVAAVIFGLSLLMNRLLDKETLGFGDVKLFLATGLHLGLVNSIFNVILTCIIGIIVILALKRKDKHTPLGPSIAGAFFITVIFGHYMTDMYISLM